MILGIVVIILFILIAGLAIIMLYHFSMCIIELLNLSFKVNPPLCSLLDYAYTPNKQGFPISPLLFYFDFGPIKTVGNFIFQRFLHNLNTELSLYNVEPNGIL